MRVVTLVAQIACQDTCGFRIDENRIVVIDLHGRVGLPNRAFAVVEVLFENPGAGVASLAWRLVLGFSLDARYERQEGDGQYVPSLERKAEGHGDSPLRDNVAEAPCFAHCLNSGAERICENLNSVTFLRNFVNKF